MKIENCKLKIRKVLFFLSAILVAGALIGVYAFFTSQPVSAAWYSDSWGFRKKLTIDYTKVSGGSDLSNFPVLVSLTDPALEKAQSSGNDILFTSSDGSTKLNHEIESFTQNTGTLVAWVQVTTLSASVNTVIYMYYGNPSSPSQQSASSTWDSNYAGVWHLKEDPSGGAPQILDSTANDNNGTSAGSMTSDDLVDAKVGKGLDFDGTDDRIDLAANSAIPGTGDATLEAFVKGDSFATVKGIFGRTIAGSIAGRFALLQGTWSGSRFMGIAQSANETVQLNGSIVTTGTWKHLVLVRNGTALNLYENGVSVASGTLTAGTTISNNSPWRIGTYPDGSGNPANWFDGIIDEVRISNTARSAGWIATEYNNQSNPSAFFSSVSSEEKGKSPVLYLKFDDPAPDGAGLVAKDSSPNKNDGTLAGTTRPTWQEEGLCVFGKCLYFNGSTASVTVANSVPNVQSVSFWVKPKTNGETLMDLDGGTHYLSASSGTISATGFTSPTIYVDGKVSSTLTANRWQQVTVTTATSFTASSIKIGNVSSSYLNGFVDEVKLYDYALTAAQVKANYSGTASLKGVSLSTQGDTLKNLSNGLVGYWKMDEASWTNDCSTATVTDSSGNGNTGKSCPNADGTQPTTGKFGNGGSFDGSNDYVTISSNFGLGTTNVTISAWVNRSDANENGMFVKIGNSGYGIGVGANNADFAGNYLTLLFQNVRWIGTSTAIGTGWHHVAMTINSSGLPSAYLDGKFIGSYTGTNAITPTATTTIGSGYNGSPYQYLQGTIDEVRVYNRALSPKEVSDLYNFAPGPKVELKMEEGSGTSANDSSGNANTGTVNSGTWTTGKYGKGVQLNGQSGSDVSVPDFSY